MATAKEIGERIRTARLDQGLGVKNAAEKAGVARDTWYRIEGGESVHDAKRHAALRFFGLDADGLPSGESPVTAENLDPRLNNIERQIDQLWQRIEQLERTGTADATTGLSADAEVVDLPRHKPADAKGPDPTGLDLAADKTGQPSEKQKQHEAEHGEDNKGR